MSIDLFVRRFVDSDKPFVHESLPDPDFRLKIVSLKYMSNKKKRTHLR